VTDDGLPAGSTVAAQWTKVSGPGTVMFEDDTRPDTTATFSGGGIYVLRLTASDGHLEASADVTVVMDGGVPPPNDPPVVVVPPSFELHLPTRTALLNGSVSDDGRPTGALLDITWRAVSGPSGVVFGTPKQAITNVTLPNVPGTHVLSLSASDSLLTATATVTITVNAAGATNHAPQVSAGANMTVTMPATAVALNGSVMDDGLPAEITVGTIWNQLSGPAVVTFADRAAATTTASFPLPGNYVLELLASDSEYLSAANVSVKVIPFVENKPPTVVASGPAQVMLPSGMAALSGEVRDDGLPALGSLVVSWTKVSGPGEVAFSRPNEVATTATFSEIGAYVLLLTADDTALSTSAELAVTVVRANQAPIVDAGPNQTIELPTHTVSLMGMVSDDGMPEGASLTTRWTVVGGPGRVVFEDSLSAATMAMFDSPGTYMLRLTANDTQFAASDDIAVSIMALSPVGWPTDRGDRRSGESEHGDRARRGARHGAERHPAWVADRVPGQEPDRRVAHAHGGRAASEQRRARALRPDAADERHLPSPAGRDGHRGADDDDGRR